MHLRICSPYTLYTGSINSSSSLRLYSPFPLCFIRIGSAAPGIGTWIGSFISVHSYFIFRAGGIFGLSTVH